MKRKKIKLIGDYSKATDPLGMAFHKMMSNSLMDKIQGRRDFMELMRFNFAPEVYENNVIPFRKRKN